jgi:mRNA interferase YafQ
MICVRLIERTNQFKRDYKREAKGRYRKSFDQDLLALLTLLVTDQALPTRYRDHPLMGEWADFRDCHIKPDLILIYQKTSEGILKLVRLGSHSELGL